MLQLIYNTCNYYFTITLNFRRELLQFSRNSLQAFTYGVTSVPHSVQELESCLVNTTH